jgi:tRNA A37 threonylcarbamoyladenosine biosynthesis protein TsaE
MHLISPEELASAITDRLARQSAVLVALDGRCGSGKTTLAAQLADVEKEAQPNGEA